MNEKKVENLLAKAYDATYDLNSHLNYCKDVQGILMLIEQFAKKQGYELILNDKTQKFKVKKNKNAEKDKWLENEVYITDKEVIVNNINYAVEVSELSNHSIEITVFHRDGDLIEVFNFD